MADHVHAGSLGLLLEFFRHALAESGAVIDHGHVLDLQFLGRIQRHLAAELGIAGIDAEQALVALCGDLRIGATVAISTPASL